MYGYYDSPFDTYCQNDELNKNKFGVVLHNGGLVKEKEGSRDENPIFHDFKKPTWIKLVNNMNNFSCFVEMK
jgi:hypothetical protein